jgi:hypothetical protein
VRRPTLAVLALATALWAGGNVALVVVAAPTFGVLRDDHPGWVAIEPATVAGGVVGAALLAWASIAWLLCALAASALAVLGARRRPLPAVLALGALVACVSAHWIYAGTLADAHTLGERKRAGDQSVIPAWQVAHDAAERWLGIETALVVGVSIGAAIALVRRTRETISATSAPAHAA